MKKSLLAISLLIGVATVQAQILDAGNLTRLKFQYAQPVTTDMLSYEYDCTNYTMDTSGKIYPNIYMNKMLKFNATENANVYKTESTSEMLNGKEISFQANEFYGNFQYTSRHKAIISFRRFEDKTIFFELAMTNSLFFNASLPYEPFVAFAGSKVLYYGHCVAK